MTEFWENREDGDVRLGPRRVRRSLDEDGKGSGAGELRLGEPIIAGLMFRDSRGQCQRRRIGMRKVTHASVGTVLLFHVVCIGQARAQPIPHEAVQARRLARQALAAVADTVVEVRPATATRPGSTSSGAFPVTFGTRPVSGGNPGVCQAEVIRVSIAAAPPSRARMTPAIWPRVQVETRFKIVGSTELPWSKASEAKLDTLCAGQHHAWDFFGARNANVAWDGAEVARLVRTAIEKTDPDKAAKIDVGEITHVDEQLCDARDKDALNGPQCVFVLIRNSPMPPYINGLEIVAAIHHDFQPNSPSWKVEVRDYNITLGPVFAAP